MAQLSTGNINKERDKKKPLTVKKVERETRPGRYWDGYGLFLQITQAGVKSWLFRYERAGKDRYMGLGPVHTFTLNEARERARDVRRILATGRDPLDERLADKSAAAQAKAAAALAAARTLTFEVAAERYYEAHKAGWKNAKHAAQFLSTLRTYAFPVVGKLAVEVIETGDVLRVLRPIWQTKTETASRVRSRMERVFAWAKVEGYRKGDNPARWSGHLKEALPSPEKIAPKQKHAALAYAELPTFMPALRKREGVAARALEFTILTAARTSEVTGATWDEFDLDAGVWTIPAERMKAGQRHRVPLSATALALLAKLPREDDNPHVFVGGRRGAAMSNMAMDAVRKRMARADITVHGFRSTFRDWAGDKTGYAREVIEQALAHTIRNKTEAAYRREDALEKRQHLMADWADFCDGKAGRGVVVQLRA